MSGSPLTRVTVACVSPFAVGTLPKAVNRSRFLSNSEGT